MAIFNMNGGGGGGIKKITTAGAFWNSDLGLISVSSDGSTWVTIADKNLGADTVFSGSVSESKVGYLYQWGNNYGFQLSGLPSTSSTPVASSGYGPGNYYLSKTFITGNNNRTSDTNNDMWGGTTNTNASKRCCCQGGFHIPTQSEWASLIQNFTSMGLKDLRSYLKMPSTGKQITKAGVITDASSGYVNYWSCTGQSSNQWAYSAQFSSSSASAGYTKARAQGYFIRPFFNVGFQPDTTWTVLYQPS